jgi:hypothetical protein
MNLWIVCEDESTHDATVLTVRSIWTTQESAAREMACLVEASFLWKCENGHYHKQGHTSDVCGLRLLGGNTCDGAMSKYHRASDFSVHEVTADTRTVAPLVVSLYA